MNLYAIAPMADRISKASKKTEHHRRLSNAKLDEMIEEVTVDAYGESEETMGFFTLLEDRLKFPFTTKLLGIEVAVERMDLTEDEQIVVVCSRGKSRQRIPILDLPLPSPLPEGAEWIDAYRQWSRGR